VGFYEKLDKLRQLYGSEPIEKIVDEIIAWRIRFNRLVQLQNTVTLSVSELQEMRAIQQQFRHDLASQRARRLISVTGDTCIP
jgi:hypothetical protein